MCGMWDGACSSPPLDDTWNLTVGGGPMAKKVKSVPNEGIGYETSILSTFLHHEVYSLHFNMTQECVGGGFLDNISLWFDDTCVR